MDDVAEVLKLGAAQKRRAATAMNDRSSRAHALFILSLTQHCPRTGVKRTSRLFLADLGGSEKVQKSLVDAGANRTVDAFSVGFQLGEHMREAVYINLGLLALKKCIEALNNDMAYVPYQDSKLTMLLSSGLGGNSKTAVLVACSMNSSDATETVAALRFGERCALIETEVRDNGNMLAGVLAQLDTQIAELEGLIRTKERWTVREERRTDGLAEAGTVEAAIGGLEVKKVVFLVGAEKERQALEKLLHRRAEFTGQSFEGEEVGGSGSGSGSGSGVAEGDKPWRKKKVMGFGKELAEVYGLGSKFDEQADGDEEIDRFEAKVADDVLPAMVRAKGGKQWLAGPVDQKKLAERAKKVNRSRLNYSGMFTGTEKEAADQLMAEESIGKVEG
jgi:kinesin family protein 5